MVLKRTLPQILFENGYTHYCCGSLPFRDAVEAVNFIISRPWILPFWPELPQLGLLEMMVNRTQSVSSSNWRGYSDIEAHGLYALREMMRGSDSKLPIVKCQLVAPFTIVEYSKIKGESFEESLAIATELCQKQIAWQKEFLKEVASSFLFVMDDPALVKWRTLDESSKVKILESYNSIYVRTSEDGSFLGLHSCAGYEPELLALPIDLYSFDGLSNPLLTDLGQVQIEEIGKVIERGIVMSPGVFPACAEGDFGGYSDSGLTLYWMFSKKLQKFEKSGSRNLLLSANCGHGTAPVDWVTFLYDPARKECV